jgi:hypothetical protein
MSVVVKGVIALSGNDNGYYPIIEVADSELVRTRTSGGRLKYASRKSYMPLPGDPIKFVPQAGENGEVSEEAKMTAMRSCVDYYDKKYRITAAFKDKALKEFEKPIAGYDWDFDEGKRVQTKTTNEDGTQRSYVLYETILKGNTKETLGKSLQFIENKWQEVAATTEPVVV